MQIGALPGLFYFLPSSHLAENPGRKSSPQKLKGDDNKWVAAYLKYSARFTNGVLETGIENLNNKKRNINKGNWSQDCY